MEKKVTVFGCDGLSDRNKIIECLYKSERLDKVIKNIVGKRDTADELREELKSELFVVLCELKDHEIVEIYNNRYLDFYIIRTIQNMFYSGGSFFQTHIKTSIVDRMSYDHIFEEEQENAQAQHDINKALSCLNWFERQVLDLYVEHGSIKKIVEITGVSYRYAQDVFNATKHKVKTQIKHNARLN